MDPLGFLRVHPPFDRLDPAALDEVRRALEIVYFPRGARILQRGAPPSAFVYMVRKGLVRLEREGHVVLSVEPGELFGFPSLIGRSSPTLDAVAGEDTLAYRLPEAVVQALMDRAPWREFFLQGLHERLRAGTGGDHGAPRGDLAAPVGALVTGPPLSVPSVATVAEAARAMREARVSSVLVDGPEPGIVTDRDLRARVLAEGLGPETPVDRVASRPLRQLDADVPVFAALGFMLEEQVHHLPLTREGRIVGVVSSTDLLRHQTRSPLFVLGAVQRAEDPAALAGYAADVTRAVQALADGGLEAAQIGRVLSALNDALAQRLLRLAERALGKPPCAYAWLAMGSEGRMEQTLLTDQDNALVYAERSPDADAYFAALAQRVVDGLLQAGVPPCDGGYMATNWHMELGELAARVRRWGEEPTPEALVDASTLLDFRRVHGALSLEPLEDAVARVAQPDGPFLPRLARAAVGFRPPLGLFRRIVREEGGVDLKRGGIMPIVGLARVRALEARTRARSTADRLAAAADAGVLAPRDAETLTQALHFLLRLRLREQLRAVAAGEPPSNRVRLEALSALERRYLKEVFAAIAEAQELLARRWRLELLM